MPEIIARLDPTLTWHWHIHGFENIIEKDFKPWRSSDVKPPTSNTNECTINFELTQTWARVWKPIKIDYVMHISLIYLHLIDWRRLWNMTLKMSTLLRKLVCLWLRSSLRCNEVNGHIHQNPVRFVRSYFWNSYVTNANIRVDYVLYA